MLLTCHPQVGGRFGQGGVEIEKNGKFLKIPKVTGNRDNLRFSGFGVPARDTRRAARGWAARGMCCRGDGVLVCC